MYTQNQKTCNPCKFMNVSTKLIQCFLVKKNDANNTQPPPPHTHHNQKTQTQKHHHKHQKKKKKIILIPPPPPPLPKKRNKMTITFQSLTYNRKCAQMFSLTKKIYY